VQPLAALRALAAHVHERDVGALGMRAERHGGERKKREKRDKERRNERRQKREKKKETQQ
jgi:hypothetical protein